MQGTSEVSVLREAEWEEIVQMLGAHWHVSSESRLLTNRKQTDSIVRPLRCEMDDLKGNSTWGGSLIYSPWGCTASVGKCLLSDYKSDESD